MASFEVENLTIEDEEADMLVIGVAVEFRISIVVCSVWLVIIVSNVVNWLSSVN